jgi:hypothetical protein
MGEQSLVPAEEPHDWTSGSGIIHDASVLWDDAHKPTDAWDWTFDGVSAGIDGLITAVDPLGAAIAAGVGWILENIPGISDCWNLLSGNPEEINRAAITWHNISQRMDDSAKAFQTSATQIEKWQGPAAQTFFTAAKDYETILTGVASDTNMLSVIITGVGCVVAALREICYWIITEWLEKDVIPEALASLASSWCTFGASVAVFLTWLIISTSLTMGVLGEKIAACSVKVAEIYVKIGEMLAKAATAVKASEEAASALAKVSEGLDKYGRPAKSGAGQIDNQHKGHEREGGEEPGGESGDDKGGSEEGG